MSPELKQFYRDLQAVLDTGAYDASWPFDPVNGICANLSRWATARGVDRYRFHGELDDQFKAAGLGLWFPFNANGAEYLAEVNAYENPKRLAWIKEHAQ